MAEKNRPKNLREGALNLAIFKNPTEHGVMYSSKLTRSYQDKEGQWQETQHLRDSDHLPASNLFQRGHDYIRDEKKRERQAQQQSRQSHGPSQNGPSI